jgi:hypothetical protein
VPEPDQATSTGEEGRPEPVVPDERLAGSEVAVEEDDRGIGSLLGGDKPTRGTHDLGALGSRGTADAGGNDGPVQSKSPKAKKLKAGVGTLSGPGEKAIHRRGTKLAPSEVQAVVARSLGQVRACYERALKADESLSGRLMVKWQIQTDGSVDQIEVNQQGIGGNETLASCVMKTIGAWKFPESWEPVDVNYPFMLRPGFG